MKKRHYLWLLLSLLVSVAILSGGCENPLDSDSNGNNSNGNDEINDERNDEGNGNDEPSTTTITATVVDPYIKGAQFCIDTGRTLQCDEDDILSTLSDEDGNISFEVDGPLPEDSLIIAVAGKTGVHNGVDYPIAMGALLDDGAQPGDHFVISPITTLRTRSVSVSDGMIDGKLTTSEVADLLKAAGLDGITTADVSADPMDGMGDLEAPLDADDEDSLQRIQSALGVYGFLLVYEEIGGENWDADAFRAAFDESDNAANEAGEILEFMVSTVKQAVNRNLINSVHEPIENANSQLSSSWPAGAPGSAPVFPLVSAEIIINGSVSVMDYIGGRAAEVSRNTNDHNQGLAEAENYLTDPAFQDLLRQQGKSYYGAHYRAELESIISAVNMGPYDVSTMEGVVGIGGFSTPNAGTYMDTGMACASDGTGFFTVLPVDEGSHELKYECIP